jgi:hypothetical protein
MPGSLGDLRQEVIEGKAEDKDLQDLGQCDQYLIVKIGIEGLTEFM